MHTSEIKEWDGMRCPKCGCQRLSVAYVRHREGARRRIRICELCGKRFPTVERVIGSPKTVVTC